jgi:hypothetical protein
MWVSRRGSDGESLTPEQVAAWRERMAPPKNELPAGVGVSALLGLTADAAVGITQVAAFSTGFRFTLAVRLRQPLPELARGGLHMLVGSHGHPDIEIAVERRLLLGLEYPDGRRGSTVEDIRWQGPGATPETDQLVIVHQGGGGGDTSVDQDYWVSPLPPDGPITVVLAWPAFGLPESRTELDGTAIREAATRSRELWPPQPDPEPYEPPPLPRPSSGWFAD